MARPLEETVEAALALVKKGGFEKNVDEDGNETYTAEQLQRAHPPRYVEAVLAAFPRELWPPVAVTHVSFQVMVAMAPPAGVRMLPVHSSSRDPFCSTGSVSLLPSPFGEKIRPYSFSRPKIRGLIGPGYTMVVESDYTPARRSSTEGTE